LGDAQRAQLVKYRRRLLAANRKLNLTAIVDPDEIDARLVDESLALLDLIPLSANSLLDIGSGGGVPGIPLAIAAPSMQVTLLDATQKKVDFLRVTAAALALANVTALQGRAEELGRDPAHREQYDVVTARAVARLAALVELALPLLRVGGVALLPKGEAAADELSEAAEALGELGGDGRLVVLDEPALRVIVVEKTAPTPERYPRRTGLPQKRPIGVPSR
jgi:16S rRNA (guanine527-N7)-methyltransferase